jgi:membrane-bound serine protease (ClpP class)
MMRSTAQAKGRDPEIAQAMVDPRIHIPGIIDTGRVLTFTTSEAIMHGFCEGEAESLDDVIEKLGYEEYETTQLKLTTIDKIIAFLVSPVVSGLLIMIIIGGIYFELQSPGVGFPLAAAVVAALLYFAPLYLEGLADHWEILLFVIGVVLIAVEIFAIPGFGVAGVLGILFIVAGLTLSMVDNIGFRFPEGSFNAILGAFFIVVIAAFLAIVGSFWLSKRILTTHAFGHLALETVQDKEEGYTSADIHYQEMLGKKGIAKTILRPSGKVVIDDELYDATAITSYIEKGATVEVVKYETSQLFVKETSTQKG